MISAIGKRPTRAARPGPSLAFTLVELILVMALLTIIISMAAPTLKRFFQGRNLDSEAARFLALTRYGQSQAVSTGIPMVLWINCTEGSYGLREAMGYNPQIRATQWTETDQNRFSDEHSWEYQLGKDLRFEIEDSTRLTNGLASIHFAPDGGIDENSLPSLMISDKDNETIPIIQTRNRLKYEIADKTNLWTSRM